MNYKSKAVRLTGTMIDEIRSGSFGAGAELPGEDALAERYRVSRSTIRRMLEILNRDGVVIRRPNRGALISPAMIRQPHRIEPRRNDTLTLAWAYAAYPDTMIARVTHGIQRYVGEHNINLQIFTSSTGHETVLDSIGNATACGVNGIILLPYILASYTAAVREAVENGLPVVTISELPGSGASSVSGDDFGGAFTVIQYLLSRHDRPCYFLGSTCETSSCRDRYDGYAAAMREAGYDREIAAYTIDLDPDGQKPEYWPLAQKELHPRELCLMVLETLETPASIFCLNDYIARGLYMAAEEKGLTVGQDLQVAGWGDMPFAARMHPPLTTVRTDSVKIGYQAARVIHGCAMGEIRKPVSLKIPAELLERVSG